MITDIFAIFWGVMILTSVAWYGFLLFYIGYKGGREIFQMIRALENRPDVANDEIAGQQAGNSQKK